MGAADRTRILAYVVRAVDGSVGMKVKLDTKWKAVLDEAIRLEQITGHKEKFTRAIHYGINTYAWDDGRRFYAPFERTDMIDGPVDPDSDQRKPFGTVEDLVYYLEEHEIMANVPPAGTPGAGGTGA